MEKSTPTEADSVVVRDNKVEDQFELFFDGAPAGILNYRVEGDDYALTHTEIDPDFEGRGLGSALISHALDQIKAGGHGMLPVCPFVLSYLDRHPEYVELVPLRYRARFDLPSH